MHAPGLGSSSERIAQLPYTDLAPCEAAPNRGARKPFGDAPNLLFAPKEIKHADNETRIPHSALA